MDGALGSWTASEDGGMSGVCHERPGSPPPRPSGHAPRAAPALNGSQVRNDPQPVIEGRDPQLEAAVQEALRLLETEAIELKPEPAPPVRWRRPNRRGG